MSESSVGDFLGASGPCPVIEFRGTKWKIGHPIQEAKAWLEDLCAEHARAQVMRMKRTLSPDDFALEKSIVMAEIKGRHYATWKPGWQQIAATPEGDELFLLSLLKPSHPDATVADVQALMDNCPDDVEAALARVIPDFFPSRRTRRARARLSRE